MSDAQETSNNPPEVVTEPLSMDAESIRGDFSHYFSRAYGQRTLEGSELFAYQALVGAVRDRIMERWAHTRDSATVDSVGLPPVSWIAARHWHYR